MAVCRALGVVVAAEGCVRYGGGGLAQGLGTRYYGGGRGCRRLVAVATGQHKIAKLEAGHEVLNTGGMSRRGACTTQTLVSYLHPTPTPRDSKDFDVGCLD